MNRRMECKNGGALSEKKVTLNGAYGTWLAES